MGSRAAHCTKSTSKSTFFSYSFFYLNSMCLYSTNVIHGNVRNDWNKQNLSSIPWFLPGFFVLFCFQTFPVFFFLIEQKFHTCLLNSSQSIDLLLLLRLSSLLISPCDFHLTVPAASSLANPSPPLVLIRCECLYSQLSVTVSSSYK